MSFGEENRNLPLMIGFEGGGLRKRSWQLFMLAEWEI
jgi:hypothetical protein